MTNFLQGGAVRKSLAELPGMARTRDRGLWNFLTRALIVSQLVVAEHFVGSARSDGHLGRRFAKRKRKRCGGTCSAGQLSADAQHLGP